MQEVWKSISGFDGYYEVSNLGRVRSLGAGQTHKTPRILSEGRLVGGYRSVVLSKNGVIKQCKVHRLVAEAFIPNPFGLPMINHKDENPSNNRVDNLEWCTARYNANYGTRNERLKAYARKVVQLSTAGEYIATWGSCRIASETLGIQRQKIGDVANRTVFYHKERGSNTPYVRRTCGGFMWVWEDEYIEKMKNNG